jgi:stage V sporulation protein D (sporulation-specific penicillin-binding protein)
MEEGGERRTGKTARPAGYAIGGKTGTAETLPRGNKEYVVSFMGYAPADDPQIAIYVVVDRPNVEKGEKQADAKFATGIVRNILTEVLPYMNIYMTEELTDEERAELQELGLKDTTGYTDADSE